MKVERKCCFIDEVLSIRCDEDAELEIWSGEEDYTDSCTKHVGEMLTDDIKHTIYRIQKDRR